ncbi:hypothetical protein TVAG_319900 [Trichomonas vaginalis G3]|uniref:NTF2 domain-containing protein n=1 Tax=Trichomonas vaginalis (strain ATCC PRA-98 / G3) TaxID=412133 RepID=A2DQD8_TRIV3|nr:Ras GTPase-activating protein-binding protein family [Trichomonas vaginalis G3]EAY17395.1 hypothetical protein TVAG_319900 [Trichomonas vaginalis G3]KAI5491405.1 Ras GTPase-activating protein-binding protein family [Trichomonas vaginalis G3]|eukprot:XP_001330764.1 hypothetical protein [Trichomonas vaginalis G3]
MSHIKDVASQFVTTYYSMVVQNYISVKKFYNSHAKISRLSPISSISFKIANEPAKEVCPDEFISGVLKVLSYSDSTCNDNLLITVYGIVKPNTQSYEFFFTQEFVLQRFSGKWFIINDVYFCYKNIDVQLYGAEQMHPMQVQGIPQHTFIPQSAPAVQPSPPIRPQSTPYQPSRIDSSKKSRPDTLDPSRSITITDLTKTYSGQEVTQIFQKYGPVRNKYFTYGTVYIEFETVEAKNAAIHSPPPIYKGQQCKVEEGIVRPR